MRNFPSTYNMYKGRYVLKMLWSKKRSDAQSYAMLWTPKALKTFERCLKLYSLDP